MINLERDGDVFILTMDAGENRWNTNFVRAFDAKLDEVLASDGPAAMITASNDPKFFSNGLDIDWRRGDGTRSPWRWGSGVRGAALGG